MGIGRGQTIIQASKALAKLVESSGESTVFQSVLLPSKMAIHLDPAALSPHVGYFRQGTASSEVAFSSCSPP